MRWLLIGFIWMGFSMEAKVLIITHSYNRPDFIEIQYKTFQKFFQDPYEYLVFNDAPEEGAAARIEEMCAQFGIECVRIPQSIHTQPYLPRDPQDDLQNPAVRCANVVQYSLDTKGFDHDGPVLIVDADLFLIREFSLAAQLKGYDLGGVWQKRDRFLYLWNGLVLLDMHTLPDKRTLNFNCTKIEGISLDVGGATYHYLQAHPDLRCLSIETLFFKTWDFLSDRQRQHPHVTWLFEEHPTEIEFLWDYTFLHYRSGTNWNHKDAAYHQAKTAILNRYIEKILSAVAVE